jgi:hypothetical protein
MVGFLGKPTLGTCRVPWRGSAYPKWDRLLDTRLSRIRKVALWLTTTPSKQIPIGRVGRKSEIIIFRAETTQDNGVVFISKRVREEVTATLNCNPIENQ